MTSTDSEGYPYDPLFDTGNDRNLETGGNQPASSGKPQGAPWSRERVHTTQEILDDLEVGNEDNNGCWDAGKGLTTLVLAVAVIALLIIFMCPPIILDGGLVEDVVPTVVCDEECVEAWATVHAIETEQAK
jgi:hypothetical protein